MRRARFHPVATLAGMILSGQSEDRRGKGASAHAQRGEKRSSDKARKAHSVTLRKAEGLSDGSSNQTAGGKPRVIVARRMVVSSGRPEYSSPICFRSTVAPGE